jgi:triosephosphate isomerase
MLSELGCSYVLLGHSERRNLFQESNDQITAKFKAAINADLIPVLCVGETLIQRQHNETQAVIAAQIQAVLDKVGIEGFTNAVVAYEPIWAIGTGETATKEQAQIVHARIRAQLAEYDVEIASTLQILYGGSVNADNAHALFSQQDIDGGLIGGASLDADAFQQICKAHS